MRPSWTKAGAITSAFGVAASGICCLPFAAALGAGVSAAGAALAPLQPYLIGVSLVFLGLAFAQTVTGSSCETPECCRRKARWRPWVFLALTAVIVVTLITAPYWSLYLILWTL